MITTLLFASLPTLVPIPAHPADPASPVEADDPAAPVARMLRPSDPAQGGVAELQALGEDCEFSDAQLATLGLGEALVRRSAPPSAAQPRGAAAPDALIGKLMRSADSSWRESRRRAPARPRPRLARAAPRRALACRAVADDAATTLAQAHPGADPAAAPVRNARGRQLPSAAAAPTASCSSSSASAKAMPGQVAAVAARERVRIGVVSISDRASAGVYEDKGIPRCATGRASAAQPGRLGAAPHCRRRGDDRRDPARAGRRCALRSGSHHRGTGPAPRDASRPRRRCRSRTRRCRASASRCASRSPSCRSCRARSRSSAQGADHQPAGPAEGDRRDARRMPARRRRSPASSPPCLTAST